MDFSRSERVDSLVDEIGDYVREELYPLEDRLADESFEHLADELDDKRAEVRELGWSTPHLPADWGGLGLDLTEFAHVAEVLGRSPVGHYVFNCQAPDAGNMELLIEHGTEEQQDRFLKPLVAGEVRSCFSMTE
ncbi:MAG: acyl-CoA dehydrogenase family protein, partial [Bradymonadaceae bacterium]